MILLLGGTTEARGLAKQICEAGFELIYSTATDYIGDTVDERARKVHGRMDEEQLTDFCRQNDVGVIVDATHPFAFEVTRNAIAAAERLKLPLFRFEREKSDFQETDFGFESWDEMISVLEDFLSMHPGKLLITTGSQQLKAFSKLPKERLIIRVLPRSGVLLSCEMLGFEPKQIVAQQGPFTLEENLAAIDRYQICGIVTKDSGKTGGCPEKIQAARSRQIPLFYLKRKSYPGLSVYSDDQKLLEALGKE